MERREERERKEEGAPARDKIRGAERQRHAATGISLTPGTRTTQAPGPSGP